MPQCCYLAKGAKRPSHTTNTIKFDRNPIDPCNSIKSFDLCPFDQKNSSYLQPPLVKLTINALLTLRNIRNVPNFMCRVSQLPATFDHSCTLPFEFCLMYYNNRNELYERASFSKEMAIITQKYICIYVYIYVYICIYVCMYAASFFLLVHFSCLFVSFRWLSMWTIAFTTSLKFLSSNLW